MSLLAQTATQAWIKGGALRVVTASDGTMFVPPAPRRYTDNELLERIAIRLESMQPRIGADAQPWCLQSSGCVFFSSARAGE